MELTLNVKAEVIEIEIVQIVVEWILNFLSDFEESKEQEGRESGARDGDPLHLGDDLEGQEQEVKPVEAGQSEKIYQTTMETYQSDIRRWA
jgi:hypothetical protein